MKNSIETDSRSPPHSGGTVTRAPAHDQNDTAQPSLTSGFGAVIEKEHNLQSAIEGSVGQVSGPHSAALDRILRHHHSRVSASIALLEQRYEALPIPDRFVKWQHCGEPPAKTRRTFHDESELLSDFVEQHTRLLADIDRLIDCAPDGQRGELILTEVSRCHQEMAWMLTALLRDNDSAKRIAHDRNLDSSRGTGLAQQNWDNEGGPVRVDPPSS